MPARESVDRRAFACCSVGSSRGNSIKCGHAALERMEQHPGGSRFLAGGAVSLADVALLAYTRLAHEGGFDLARHAAIRRWIGETENNLNLTPVR